jgi:hypothetical protein
MRHHDHKFEWTRVEFEAWARAQATKYGYAQLRFDYAGELKQHDGAPTQIAIFNCNNQSSAESSNVLKHWLAVEPVAQTSVPLSAARVVLCVDYPCTAVNGDLSPRSKFLRSVWQGVSQLQASGFDAHDWVCAQGRQVCSACMAVLYACNWVLVRALLLQLEPSCMSSLMGLDTQLYVDWCANECACDNALLDSAEAKALASMLARSGEWQVALVAGVLFIGQHDTDSASQTSDDYLGD